MHSSPTCVYRILARVYSSPARVFSSSARGCRILTCIRLHSSEWLTKVKQTEMYLDQRDHSCNCKRMVRDRRTVPLCVCVFAFSFGVCVRVFFWCVFALSLGHFTMWRRASGAGLHSPSFYKAHKYTLIRVRYLVFHLHMHSENCD